MIIIKSRIIFGVKIKEKKLINESDISGFINKSDSKIKQLATKAELKAEQDKIVKLETYELSHFLGKNLYGNGGSQNMSVYQPTIITLELKVNKSTEYAIGWKSKGLHKSKLLPFYGTFLPNIKYFGHKTVIQFDNTTLALEQNNYAIKTVNAYIVYYLDNLPQILSKNCTLHCLFGATVTVKITIKNNGCTVAME